MIDQLGLAARFKRLPVALRLAMLLPGIALGIYFAQTSSGPWRWLYDLQMHAERGYRPLSTYLFTIAICVAPLWVLAYWLAGRFPERR